MSSNWQIYNSRTENMVIELKFLQPIFTITSFRLECDSMLFKITKLSYKFLEDIEISLRKVKIVYVHSNCKNRWWANETISSKFSSKFFHFLVLVSLISFLLILFSNCWNRETKRICCRTISAIKLMAPEDRIRKIIISQICIFEIFGKILHNNNVKTCDDLIPMYRHFKTWFHFWHVLVFRSCSEGKAIALREGDLKHMKVLPHPSQTQR